MIYWSGDGILVSLNTPTVLTLLLGVLVLLGATVIFVWMVVHRLRRLRASLSMIQQEHTYTQHADSVYWLRERDTMQQQIRTLQAIQDTQIARNAYRPVHNRIQRFLTLSEEDYTQYQHMEDEMHDLFTLFPVLPEHDTPEREQLL